MVGYAYLTGGWKSCPSFLPVGSLELDTAEAAAPTRKVGAVRFCATINADWISWPECRSILQQVLHKPSFLHPVQPVRGHRERCRAARSIASHVDFLPVPSDGVIVHDRMRVDIEKRDWGLSL